jgi:hypothetical protein
MHPVWIGLRVSSLFSDPALCEDNQKRLGRTAVSSSLLADSAVVTLAFGASMRDSAGHSARGGSSGRPERPASTPFGKRESTANRLAVARSGHEARGISKNTIKYLLAPDRPSTSATYQNAWGL